MTKTKTFDDATERYTDVRNVPTGTYIKRKAEAKKVYIAAGYCRGNRAYEIVDADDINRSMFIKGGKPVFVGFTY